MPLLVNPRVVIVNSAGQPYALAKMLTYRAGTEVALPTYTDATYGVEHTNPVVADANGVFAPIYLDPALGYNLRIIITDSNDVTIAGYDIDNIPRADNSFPASSFSGNVTVTGNVTASANVRANGMLEVYAAEPRIVLNETDRGTDLKFWDIDLNGGVLSIRTRTDADGAGKNAIVITRGSTTAIASIAIGNATDLPAITLNGLNLLESTGSFTATLAGMAAPTTGLIYYRIINGKCTLYRRYADGALTGTSNDTVLNMTGVPAACQPLKSTKIPCVDLRDDSESGLAGAAFIAGADLGGGSINFFLYNPTTFTDRVAVSAVFTSGNLKGLEGGWSITYDLLI